MTVPHETIMPMFSFPRLVNKRYSEFRVLFLQLKGSKLNAEQAIAVKQASHLFPPKSVVSNKRPKFLDSRRRDLETWLVNVLSIPRALENKAIRNFVNLPASVLGSSGLGDKLGSSFLDALPTYTLQDLGLPIIKNILPTSLWQASIIECARYAIATENPAATLHRISCQQALSLAGVNSPTSSNSISGIVTHEFKSLFDRDLSCRIGEVVSVVGQDQPTGWWLAQYNGSLGLVPPQCIAIIAPTPDPPLTPSPKTTLLSTPESILAI